MDRRTFLGLGAGAGAALWLTGCGQGGASPTSGDAESASLRFCWWGNDTRNQLTNQAIEAYRSAHSGVTIAPEPGEWSGYWDKLATQFAASDAPDIIQMDEKYLAEYGQRGGLLDLEAAGVDVSGFAAGTADTGRLSNGLLGINAGVNAPVLVANPQLFEQAGVELPDDTTWTWPQFMELSAELTSKLGQPNLYGAGNLFSQDGLFKAYVRQRGGQQWTPDGTMGWEPAMLEDFWQMLMDMQAAGSIQSPAELAEEDAKPMDQTAIATGRVAMTYLWSNQIKALDNASGVDMALLRPPSVDGSVDGWLWYKASMYWSASSRTENPAAAAAFVDWLANSPDCAKILTAERGLPPNLACREAIAADLPASDKKVAAFLDSIESEVVDAGGITPVGGSTFQQILLRKSQDVLFDRASIADAVASLRTEVESGLQS
ncbi:MAG: extracellular solute-binding protein [Propionibacteriaceae bacterium]|nr:extracellular solute-binding protein [Propionibacteriaceae bacterium]